MTQPPRPGPRAVRLPQGGPTGVHCACATLALQGMVAALQGAGGMPPTHPAMVALRASIGKIDRRCPGGQPHAIDWNSLPKAVEGIIRQEVETIVQRILDEVSADFVLDAKDAITQAQSAPELEKASKRIVASFRKLWRVSLGQEAPPQRASSPPPNLVN